MGGFSGILTALVANIPQKHIARVGRLLGMFVYIVDLRHRRIVRRNLQFTHPEWSRESIQRSSKRVFQNIGITFLEICQMTCFSREDVLRQLRIRGEENLLNAIRNPRGYHDFGSLRELGNGFPIGFLLSPEASGIGGETDSVQDAWSLDS